MVRRLKVMKRRLDICKGCSHDDSVGSKEGFCDLYWTAEELHTHILDVPNFCERLMEYVVLTQKESNLP